ncbi:MAG: hypothetical protein IJ419_06700 [Agathobacter sp.]|nr:hypothetical protein [Agathobacter sp.]
MEKTKLGISTALLGALACLACYYGGITATLLVVGAILILENDEWLKKTCVRAAVLVFLFLLTSSIIYILPNIVSCISSTLGLFEIPFYIEILSKITSWLSTLLDLLEKIVFLGLALLALMKVNVHIPVLDNFIDKHLNK